MSCEDNPIGALQELSQAQGGRPSPYYELQAVSGESHCPHFVYEARWDELRAVGEGSNKVNKQTFPVLKHQIFSNGRKERRRALLRNC